MHTYPSIIGDVRGSGLFLGVEIIGGNPSSTTQRIADEMLNVYRTIVTIDGENDSCLVFKPPLVFNFVDSDYLLWALEECLCPSHDLGTDFSGT
jgi:4-aminobutyrate aminotransferase-like enzyme